MADPILVPAYPAMLRAGLPVVDRDDGEVGVLIRADPDLPWQVSVYRGGYGWDLDEMPGAWSCNLRDPAVRDACVRALWRKLGADRDEPFSLRIAAAEQYRDARRAVTITGILFHTDAERIAFEWDTIDRIDATSTDARLLALAAVLAHVLGGGR